MSLAEKLPELLDLETNFAQLPFQLGRSETLQYELGPLGRVKSVLKDFLPQWPKMKNDPRDQVVNSGVVSFYIGQTEPGKGIKQVQIALSPPSLRYQTIMDTLILRDNEPPFLERVLYQNYRELLVAKGSSERPSSPLMYPFKRVVPNFVTNADVEPFNLFTMAAILGDFGEPDALNHCAPDLALDSLLGAYPNLTRAISSKALEGLK
jgi:hypothetical protein